MTVTLPRTILLAFSLVTVMAMTGLLGGSSTRAQEPTPPPLRNAPPQPEHLKGLDRGMEIMEACNDAGLAVRCVRALGPGKYKVDCEEADQARAEEIVARILASPARGQTPVVSIQEALVVLQFEPRNREARKLLKSHYNKLRQRHLEQLKREKR